MVLDAHTHPLATPEVVAGMIMLWSGSAVSIPAGWVLCNGGNGTPDLRNRFVVGAMSAYAVGAAGGGTTHDHEIAETHSHDLESDSGVQSGSDLADYTDESGDGIYTESSLHLPPYYALCYIMKT